MDTAEIAWRRFFQQGLLTSQFESVVDVVASNGAIQAQDYAGAKWAVAQRTRGFISDVDMDHAFNRGTILRTHVMRPTWHFVTPADIRWLLKLTAPRVHVASAYYYRTLGLDATTFRQCHALLISALEGGKHLTRAELTAKLHARGITGDTMRHGYILMHAELEGLICSGPRQGKQFTYALLEERVPPAKEFDRDEALAALAMRYFTSHGPALLKDFVWWSGLTVAEATQGTNLAGSALEQDTFNGQSCWASSTQRQGTWASPTAHLLPNYDEALASFKDYSAAMDPHFETGGATDAMPFAHYLVINGRVVGAWKRTLSKHMVRIETKAFRPLDAAESQAIAEAASRYGEYLGLSVEIDC